MVKTFNYKKNEKESATLREVFVVAENDKYVRGLDLGKMREANIDTDEVIASFGEDYKPSDNVAFMTKSVKAAKKEALEKYGVKEGPVKAEWVGFFRTFDKSKFVK